MFLISSGSYDGNNEDKEYLRAVKVSSRSLIIRLSLQSNYFDLHSLLSLSLGRGPRQGPESQV